MGVRAVQTCKQALAPSLLHKCQLLSLGIKAFWASQLYSHSEKGQMGAVPV